MFVFNLVSSPSMVPSSEVHFGMRSGASDLSSETRRACFQISKEATIITFDSRKRSKGRGREAALQTQQNAARHQQKGHKNRRFIFSEAERVFALMAPRRRRRAAECCMNKQEPHTETRPFCGKSQSLFGELGQLCDSCTRDPRHRGSSAALPCYFLLSPSTATTATL